ncbi:tetratricopeptide repeat protein [Streptomyces sp. XM4011]|uniref:tetratricopeptide repeat protein n=1 Tax=Streptomyces TaxID=1883 RepID=UPI001590C749|nr:MULTISPECIES: tetratricopeptide repeat protein [Streptomyces]MCK1813152.1 tetratricopeptide repeat protein [Streptomyces sp. XM4011]QKV68728.1 tetratricopeptide repeat protein [Streptomyces harbinensis]
MRSDDPYDGGWDERLAALWDAIDQLEPAVFRARMGALAAERPGEARALFELASAHDATDREEEAARYYQEAFAAGLSGDLRVQAVIQYASTLRNLGRAQEGADLLTAERAAAGAGGPLVDEISAFTALALLDLGRDRDAALLALRALTPHLSRYRASVTGYLDVLEREGC